MPLTLRTKKAWLSLFGGLFLLLLSMAPDAQATHIRAGNIYSESDPNNYLKFRFTLITYTVLGGFEDTHATLHFGDCTSQRVELGRKYELQNGQNNTQVNEFYFEHTYGGAGTFTVSYIGENRNGGIINLSNSVQQTFFLQSTVTIDPFLGINRSPILQYEPIDLAARNQVFVHNPGAYDPDGDSLSFKMLQPRIEGTWNACGNPIPQIAPGYRGLEQFLGTTRQGAPVGFTLNTRTGQVTWNTPGVIGEFNIAFVVEEWRDNRLIGQVIRDMQIFVREDPNQPPRLIIPRDTCIIAGTFIRDTIRATDPDRHPIVMEAVGSMLPPATFPSVNDTTHVFNWQTSCSDIRREPYQVVFRAEDRPPSGIRLVDLQPWRITVVAPPPVLTLAVPASSNSIRLTWENYTCPNAETMYIYRKEGPSGFDPSTCDTGIPASAGYTLVGQVNAGVVTFLDDNNGAGLERNRTYCYRIYAGFPEPGRGESIASNEVCATLESIAMTKVSVQQTSTTNGQIRVEWSKPGAIVTTLTPPFQYRLLRTVGQSREPAAQFTEVFTSNDLNDTVFTDTNLNTEENAYVYRIEMYHSANVGEPTVLVDSSSASSVRLNAVANASTMQLQWTYNVPWNNASTSSDANPLYHVVYLKLPGSDEFVRYDSALATTTSGTFSREVPLVEGENYCAYVITRGTFTNPRLPSVTENYSQINCFSRPCVPVLSIDPLVCDENFEPTGPPFQNILTWELTAGCDPSLIDFYTLYYRETDDGEFRAIATVEDMSYIHQNLLFYSGCYMVTATDFFGNESEPSNTVCKDNCIIFILPNIFTPNNDGINDVFTPKQGAAFIKSAKLQVYNRWGVKVFEGTEEPGLNWRGVTDNGKALSDGTYFYQVEVEFYGRSPEPDRRTFKGWVEIVH
ncbi:T9SS type B sorting domain-containing protein [Rufibacter roseus]|uniref:Gliding motility-associated C-terminal domain-containing protein n=1 Tax=Rufibacter roseus TaxID=1567108 RepID=A0ABW2DRU0_9BACT|nr:gliding motility-associated C-terminal domain-containing protein [Rufibacter roseus]